MADALLIDVERRFPGGPVVRARAEIPLDGPPVTVLFGPSGSGKTTVLRCIAGLDAPGRGTIRFRGETWFDSEAKVAAPPQRRGVGLVFQEAALFPHLTVSENLAYGLFALSRAGRESRTLEVARLCGLEPLLGRRPGELSGGERQRAALARALAPRPRLLLLDEPLSALDVPAREELRGELRRVLEGSGVPAILVTHDRAEALAIGDRMAVLAEGGVRQVGRVEEVFGNPADAAVARLVGMENVLPAKVLSVEEGLATVSVGTARLLAVAPDRLGAEAFACIRAEDIVLEEAPGAPTSARNLLPASVTAVAREGPLVRVTLDCGFRLVALVTRRSAERLGLGPGKAAAALVKAPSVRLVPRDPA